MMVNENMEMFENMTLGIPPLSAPQRMTLLKGGKRYIY
jgi:hypothetical protein